MSGGSASGTAEARFRPPFTASQWQELEHQALIYKYLTAGVPVPPELLVPIRKSFESTLATQFLYHPSVNYYSFYGRKIDPEPGRCRRTDGKKWRCSKDAYPDSKYCERHMHRGRNRSRKLVELQTTSHPSSTVTSQVDAGSSSGNQNLCNLRLHSAGNLGLTYLEGSNITQTQMVPDPYGFGNKEIRYTHQLKADVNEQNLLPKTSGTASGLSTETIVDSTLGLMPSQPPSNTLFGARSGTHLESNYAHLQPVTIDDVFPKQQPQQELGSSQSVQQQEQPFLYNWSGTRNTWSDVNDQRLNKGPSSSTQLSIAITEASSKFSAASGGTSMDG